MNVFMDFMTIFGKSPLMSCNFFVNGLIVVIFETYIVTGTTIRPMYV